MNMVHLTKCQIITINLTKPYPFNMANLTKPWLVWWTFVHFDQIFGLTFGQIGHLMKCNICFSCPKPLIKMDKPFGQCGHFDQVGLLKSRDFLYFANLSLFILFTLLSLIGDYYSTLHFTIYMVMYFYLLHWIWVLVVHLALKFSSWCSGVFYQF
jgi:hypothetical protein